MFASSAAAFGEGVTNADCLACHAVAGQTQHEVDFHVGPVDKAKCNNCHWLEKHYFDVFHAGPVNSDYMQMDCSICHGQTFGFPPRPQPFLGYPTANTTYGWFQSASSPDTSSIALHRIHANGSWEKGDSFCVGCHGNAACDACHSAPALSHTEHTNLGEMAVPITKDIGKKYGDGTFDTYIYSYVPTGNYDSASAMYVGATTRGEERGLLRMPLDKIAESEISTVTLRLTKAQGVRTLRAYRLRRDWQASSASWNNYRTGVPWGTAGAKSPAMDYYDSPYAESSNGTFNVTSLVQAALAEHAPFIDLLLVDPAPVAGSYSTFYSSNCPNPDYYPVLRSESTTSAVSYAYPPVTYPVGLGSVIGDESSQIARNTPSTCVNGSCHSLSNAGTAEFKPTCISCHTDADHEALHQPDGLDEKCLTCHKDNLVEEHLRNGDTQTSELTCITCHGSLDNRAVWSIYAGDKKCSACHFTAHGLGLSPAPTGVPLYAGFQWSPPIDAQLFSGETWIGSSSVGQLVLSSRRADVTASDVFAWYSSQLTSGGWLLDSPAPPSGATSFNVMFTKGSHVIRVVFFDTEAPDGGPVVSSGNRIQIVYR
jgi:hypothetical protein